MGAVEVIPDPMRAPDALSLSPAVLALVIAGVAISVLGMSFIGVLADRRLAEYGQASSKESIISQLSLARQQVEESQREVHQQKLKARHRHQQHGRRPLLHVRWGQATCRLQRPTLCANLSATEATEGRSGAPCHHPSPYYQSHL